MGAHKLSWTTIVLLLLPFIGILIVVLQRWIESMEEPVSEKPVHATGTEGHGHGEAAAEVGEGPVASEAVSDAASAPEPEVKPAAEIVVAAAQPTPEAIAAEAQPAPEAITAEAQPAPEVITAEAQPAPEVITAEVQPAPEAIAAEVQPAPEAITAEAQPAPEETPTVDDLEIIEGIGPKIASVLREAGITSFVRLAQATPDELRGILKAARVRLAAPESWPHQARLAAEGRWEELRTYQDQLKGGR